MLRRVKNPDEHNHATNKFHDRDVWLYISYREIDPENPLVCLESFVPSNSLPAVLLPFLSSWYQQLRDPRMSVRKEIPLLLLLIVISQIPTIFCLFTHYQRKWMGNSRDIPLLSFCRIGCFSGASYRVWLIQLPTCFPTRTVFTKAYENARHPLTRIAVSRERTDMHAVSCYSHSHLDYPMRKSLLECCKSTFYDLCLRCSSSRIVWTQEAILFHIPLADPTNQIPL